MEKWQKLEGKAAALMRKNIDTDIITPMRHIVSMGRDDMHKIAFDPLRFREDGSENPEFVLNRNAFRGAPILIAGANFGCGSSRETAVWAIKGLGIRCVIAESFGDIFHNNCFQNAILPIRLPADEMELMAAEAENPEASARFTIDLQACEITTPTGRIVTFTVDPDRREALLEGLDDIARTMRLEDDIAAFQEADRAAHPWIYDTAR